MRKLYPFVKLTQKISTTMGRRLALLFLICGFLAASANAQTIRYVNASASGSNNGLSWANAYTSLQSALDAALSGDEIFVAKGTYKPSKDHTGSTNPGDARTKTFLLKSGVKLYGGYDAASGARSITANPTILSGDIGVAGNITDNSYHVMVGYGLTTAAELNGVTISEGNADNLDNATVFGEYQGHNRGAGLLLSGGTGLVTINNCVFTNNKGTAGTALYGNAPFAVLNSVFSGNNGATIIEANYNGGSFINCVFTGNTAYWGGALQTSNTTSIINCTIANNHASFNGKAIFASGTTTIKNSILWGNGGSGPVIYTPNNAPITISYSNIEGGYAGTGNINTDPVFDKAADWDGADNSWMTADDGLHLREASPSANSGNNTDATGIGTDITGAARIQNTTVNMGAYESVKIPQTITFNPIGAKTYGDAAFTVSATASSNLPITSYSIISGPATISGNTVTITGAGSVVIRAFQSGNATYSSAEATQTLTVTKNTLTVTADAKSKVYGDANPLLTATITGFVNGDTKASATTGNAALSTTVTTTTAAGDYSGAITAAVGSLASSNYDFTFAAGTLTVTKAVVTITAADKTMIQGTTLPALTILSYNSFKNGETVADLTKAPVLSTTATTNSAPGPYPITVNGAEGANYTFVYVNGTLTVTPCTSVTINTQPQAQVKCAGENVTFSVGATGTGLSYQWMKGSTPVGTNSNTYTINGVATGDAGEYSVIVTSGCSVTSNKATLTVNSVSTPTITVNGNVLTSSAAAGNQWYLNNAPITGATAKTYTVQAAGPYKVTVTQNGCSATSAVHDFVPTAVGGVVGSVSGVRVFPTVVENNVFTLENTTGHALEVVIMDNKGQAIRSVKVSSSRTHNVSVAGLANGVYLVAVNDAKEGTTTTHRVIKVQ